MKQKTGRVAMPRYISIRPEIRQMADQLEAEFMIPNFSSLVCRLIIESHKKVFKNKVSSENPLEISPESEALENDPLA